MNSTEFKPPTSGFSPIKDHGMDDASLSTIDVNPPSFINEDNLNSAKQSKRTRSEPMTTPLPVESSPNNTRTPKRTHKSGKSTPMQMPPSSRKKSILQEPMGRCMYSAASSSDVSTKIITQLKSLYKHRVKPLESKYGLYDFCLPTNAPMQDAEFDAKPMVLMIGQYSTGKTTFLRHLVGGDFPSMHIGPEPTTDRFMALIHGNADEYEEEDMFDKDLISYDDNYMSSPTANPASGSGNVLTEAWKKDGQNRSNGTVIKGNSLTVMPELPFASLSTFGTGFLSHFVGSVTPAPLLEHITLIDTPGVLSGEKQRLSRSYDFAKASKWFADRSDLILLLFDAHKLDISDELKDVIETIRPHNDDKVRCVLNKADGVTREQLVRVYGSLMWSMGKIFKSPEVVRVYTGSYWDEPLVHDDFETMFESDEWLLTNELVNLPRSCAERKVNEVVKRIRIIKVHICLLSYLKQLMPRWFGRKQKQEELIDNLKEIFVTVRLEYKLSSGDFPDVREFARCLRDVDDFHSFTLADKKTLKILDDLIAYDIPKIMKGTAGVTGSTPAKKKRRTPMKRGNADKKVGPVDSDKSSIDLDLDSSSSKSMSSPVKSETNTPTNPIDLLKASKAYKEPKKSSSSQYWILLFVAAVAYALLFYLVVQDPTNSLGLPPQLVDHFADALLFIKNNIYDPREFKNLVME